MRKFQAYHCVLGVALLLTTMASGVAAQEFRATLTGRITDPNGLAVPGATITAANIETGRDGVARPRATKASYTIPFLRPGNYSVSVELDRLREDDPRGTSSSKSARPRRSISSCRSAIVSETVNVSAGDVLLETSKADRGMVIDNQRVHGAAAERAQSVHAVVSLARHHLQRPGDLSAAVRQRRDRRLVDQRRPEPQQRVPARRRAEQLDPGRQQHRLRAAGGRRAGIQDRHQQLRRAVRPHRRRRRQRVAQVGDEQLSRHGVRVRAPQGASTRTSIYFKLNDHAEARSQARSVRLPDRWPGAAFPASTTDATRRSSCSTTRATGRRRRTRRPTPCPTRRSCAATSAICATRRAA